jgi:hypothetical protein
MSDMALFWVLLFGGGLVLGVVHPFFPLFSYLVFYYMPPHVNWWGRDLPDARYSLIASIVLLGSATLLNSALPSVKKERNPALPWLALFAVNALLVTIGWSLSKTRSMAFAVLVLKLLMLYVLIPVAVRTPLTFDAFGASHVAGAWYWGYKAWDNPHREAGRLMEVGGPDTQDDNQASGHLVTVIPFVALYALTARRKWVRGLAAVAGAFIVNVFILCNSRGGTVGLFTAGMVAVLFAGKGRRSKLIGVGVAGALALLLLADPQFIARQQTTANPTDNSAQSRLVMWSAGLRVVHDYPLGGGGRAFHILSPRYIPDIVAAHSDEERSPHNTAIQLATDWGIQGALLFCIFIFMTMKLLRDVCRRAHDPWYFYRALTIIAALAGTLVASIFSSRLYGESIYWMCALAFALHRIQSTALEQPAEPPGGGAVGVPAVQKVTPAPA